MSDKKAVIVFVFPEPEGNIEFGLIIEKAKTLFAGKPDIKMYAGINDPAKKVITIFEGDKEEEGNWVRHAKTELDRIANDKDFNESIIEAVRVFSKYGHSGGSASVAIPMLNDLLQFKNLTPLTDDPKEWNKISNEEMWQSTRNSEAFSSDGGKTYYLLSEGADSQNQTPLHTSEKING